MLERVTPTEISFKPMAMLRVNGEPIEVADVTPYELSHFVTDTSTIITDHIEKMYAMRIAKARNPEMKVRPSIFIARLALDSLVYDQHHVFTHIGRHDLLSIHTDPNHLNPTAREYFEELQNTPFTPEVRIRRPSDKTEIMPGTLGIWLSLASRPKPQ